jgi:hypothetical protein
MLLYRRIMWKRTLELVVLLSFTALTSTSAVANPITGGPPATSAPAGEEDDGSGEDASERDERAAAAAFDATALFDLSGMPILRVSGPSLVMPGDRDKLRAPRLMQDEVVTGLVSGAPSGIGSVSFTPETGPIIIPNPGGGGGGSGISIAEPVTLLLFAPAAAYGLWRRRRQLPQRTV